MATPLDIGLLANFQILFPFLFVFCIVFGIMLSTKFLGENKGLQATIALVLAFMTLFSDIAVETINTAAPWFVLMVIFIVFLMLGFMILGVKEADFLGVMRSSEYSWVNWWVVGLVIVIVFGSLSHVMAEKRGGFGPYVNENLTVEQREQLDVMQETQEGDFWKTMFHPKVLGLLVIMLIAFFTVSKLTSNKA